MSRLPLFVAVFLGLACRPQSGVTANADAVSSEAEALPSATSSLSPWMWSASRKLTEVAQGRTRAWDRLAWMVDAFGHRLSGSPGLEQSIDWAAEQMNADGLANVHREPVMVPRWVRGKESLRIVGPADRPMTVLGLGMSVGTQGALRGVVVVVDHVDAIAGMGQAARGKIVLINQRMPLYNTNTRDAGYGDTVMARVKGASIAAQQGAKAVLVRSVTAHGLDTPHTGSLVYTPGIPQIPAAAVTGEGADQLVRMAKRGTTEVELQMGARQLEDAESANVIGEIRGREKPEEIVLLGAHIDSWDVGDGAADDGGGCLMMMEAASLLRELGLVPRRTLRVVLFTNEENGLGGARAYYDAHRHEQHVAVIEADSGAGAPWGFNLESSDPAVQNTLRSWSPLFTDLGADHMVPGHSGSDIGLWVEAGVLGVGVRPDARHYFDVHHSRADTVEKIDPTDLERNAAAVALFAYLLAEQPQDS